MNHEFQLVEYDHTTMFEEIKNLFIAEYGVEHIGENGEFFELFYNSEFQRNKAIAIVALHNERVCAFQAFFYWPYIFEGRKLNTFQSGNSLVHSNYRGMGLFSRMLKHIEVLAKERGVDFLVGFPVQRSYGSFLRAGWSNPLDLIWRIKFVNLLSVFNNRPIDLAHFDLLDENTLIEDSVSKDTFRLDASVEIAAWRNGIRSYRINKVYTFLYSENGNNVQFEFKPNYRGRINEVIIGNISMDCRNPSLLKLAFKQLVKKLQKSNVTIISICINDLSSSDLVKTVIDCMLFIRINKKIHFITKNLMYKDEINNPKLWNIFRSDVDTW